MLPHWRFKTERIARESSEEIFAQFLSYKEKDDFVGMDMARKFLQMVDQIFKAVTCGKGAIRQSS